MSENKREEIEHLAKSSKLDDEVIKKTDKDDPDKKPTRKTSKAQKEKNTRLWIVVGIIGVILCYFLIISIISSAKGNVEIVKDANYVIGNILSVSVGCIIGSFFDKKG